MMPVTTLMLQPKTGLARLAAARPDFPEGLRSQLERLVASLNRVVAPAEGSGPFADGEAWDDDTHVYLELGPLLTPSRDLDLTVHNGRVFVRIER